MIRMLNRYLLYFSLFVLNVSRSNAQIYDCDSLKIEIISKSKFSAKDYKDLNIDVVFISKSKGKSTLVYQKLESAYKSTFGNCYFELYKYDSTSKAYKSITFDIMGSKHPPKVFKDEVEILTYDLKKSLLKFGEERKLTFNLLNYIPTLLKGEYSMKFYLRNAGIYGYGRKQNIITNSISYLESTIMNFEVLNTIDTPNHLQYP